MRSLLGCTDVHFSRGEQHILRGVTLNIAAGERICLLGRNGAGKSSLMRILAGSWRADAGQVLINGAPVAASRKARNQVRAFVQMVLQEPDDQLFATSVAADVAYGPTNMGLDAAQVQERVEEVLASLGIADLADAVPHQLSFGQRKRVALAGALAMRPSVLLLDEPTAGLDPEGTSALIETLENLGTALLFSTHDVNAAWRLATRFVVLHDGELHSGGVEMITDHAFMKAAGLEVPWAPTVSAALGREVKQPSELL